MADDFQDDYEGFDEGMLEWFYLEEDYPLAVSIVYVPNSAACRPKSAEASSIWFQFATYESTIIINAD